MKSISLLFSYGSEIGNSRESINRDNRKSVVPPNVGSTDATLPNYLVFKSSVIKRKCCFFNIFFVFCITSIE